MTRIILLSCLLSTTVFAQKIEVELPSNPVIKGSLVCGEKVMRIAPLLTNLKMLKMVNKRIVSDLSSKTITINYLFNTDTISAREVDTTILNDFFPKVSDYSQIEQSTTWQLVESYGVGGVSVGPDMVYNINPYVNCFEYSYSCSKVKVVRKSVRELCPSIITTTKYKKLVQNDTLRAIFRDSSFITNTICTAIGNYILSDSIVFEKLDNKDYKLRVAETNWEDVVCVTTPCPKSIEIPVTSKILGSVNMANCLPTGYENETTLEQTAIIYPNPASKLVYINEAESDLILTDKLGKEIIIYGDKKYSLSGVAPGLYFASFEWRGRKYTQKLLIE